MSLIKITCTGCGAEVKVKTYGNAESQSWKGIPCPHCDKNLFEVPSDMAYKITEYYLKGS